MLDVMTSKPSKPSKGKTRKERHVIFMTLDESTEKALKEFISSHPVEPDRAAVGLKALRELLKAHGFYPPKN
jgi:hypothetical protein